MEKGPHTITGIEATADTIKLHGLGPLPDGEVRVWALPPYANGDAQPESEPVFTGPVAPQGAGFTINVSRFHQNRDLLYAAFRVEGPTGPMAGPRYATTLTNVARSDYPYPTADTIKGLQVRENMVDDALALGVQHAAINLNQGDVMVPEEDSGTASWEVDGEVFYFDELFLARYDALFRKLSDNGVVLTMILLNSPNWRRPIHPDMERRLLHPNYDREGFISAFRVMDAEGWRAYRAFVEFVADRYTREDRAFGRISGFVVGNEVDSQWVWSNAGEMPAEAFMREYSVALRTAWYAVQKACSSARAYISLDHMWTIPHLPDPLRTYPARKCLELLNEIAVAEGNYPWAVAFHPYPEDLRFPDFWNDPTVRDDFDTPRISFKNLEQLPRFLRQDAFLYNGACRPIILSEQGFNSLETEESEAFQAAAYALAYRKVLECPEIESFILHAHADNLQEFGLHLGLWRVDENNEPVSKKPVYDVFRDIDGSNGDAVYEAALPFLERKMDRSGEAKLF